MMTDACSERRALYHSMKQNSGAVPRILERTNYDIFQFLSRFDPFLERLSLRLGDRAAKRIDYQE
ncbi:MAG TPA: hypothetical protein VJ652_07650, partial [Noviherbaspirillum sp.]|nr:hypothetical protein [Noviherbaspirillum sp.]